MTLKEIRKVVRRWCVFGSSIAAAISWDTNHSIRWAIVHAWLGWCYIFSYWMGWATK